MTTQLRTRSASSLLEGRDVSSNTRSAPNLAARRSASWRCESPLKRRLKKQERQESSLSYADHLFYSGTGADPLRGHTDPRSLAGGGDATIRKYYIDPLTGEMKYLSSRNNVQQHSPDIVYYHPSAHQDVQYDLVRRIPAENSRLKSAHPHSSSNRSFWDHSLRTKSINANNVRSNRQHSPSRPIDSRHSVSRPVDSRQSSSHPNTRLPRLTKDPPGSPSYETSSNNRYPRGQQRPTSMASGHHALLLRHQKLVEASRRQPRDRMSYAGPSSDFMLDDSPLYQHPPTSSRTTRAISPVHNMRLLAAEYHSKMYPRGCSQEAGNMISKVAHQKCQDWLNTWIED